MARVAAVILAAGESSRFGKPKQLLELNQKSLVRRIVDEARDADCSPVVVVTGDGRDEIKRQLAGTLAVTVDNENWKHGIGTSIRAGIRYLTGATPEIDAVVLLVCDQPLVDASMIRDLIALGEKTHKPIVSSRYAETVGVPALFNRMCFDELLALDGDSGAKAIILSNSDRIAELPFPDGAIDLDTIQDWENFGRRVTT
jgi:molybdenum cofactor cytidylyltransferase